jgi:hypothetical protein
MVPGSKCVFIVGFERCMTTSLATYLVDNGYCSLLVPGVKEPSIFASEPELARRIVERESASRPEKWLLDGSVDYIINPDALRAIAATVEDHRIIVCMRNQFARTLSAFAYYQEMHTRPANPATLFLYPNSWKFGDEALRSWLASHDLAPAFMRCTPPGRYCFTAVSGSVRGLAEGDPRVDDLDAAVETFSRRSLPDRIVDELRYQRRHGQMPPISVLLYSYFNYGLRQVLSIIDRARVTLVTPESTQVRQTLRAHMDSLLGVTGGDGEFQRTNPSSHVISAHDKALAEDLLAPSLRSDTAKVTDLVQSLDLSMFADVLYR